MRSPSSNILKREGVFVDLCAFWCKPLRWECFLLSLVLFSFWLQMSLMRLLTALLFGNSFLPLHKNSLKCTLKWSFVGAQGLGTSWYVCRWGVSAQPWGVFMPWNAATWPWRGARFRGKTTKLDRGSADELWGAAGSENRDMPVYLLRASSPISLEENRKWTPVSEARGGDWVSGDGVLGRTCPSQGCTLFYAFRILTGFF